MFAKTVKNGGVLQRLVEKKNSGEKKKWLLGGWEISGLKGNRLPHPYCNSLAPAIVFNSQRNVQAWFFENLKG